MPEDISLLPKEVEKKKEQEIRDRRLRRGGLVFLAVTSFIFIGVFAYLLVLKSQLSNLKQDIADEVSKVTSLSEIELSATDLEKRVGALAKIFDEKLYFSDLLDVLIKAVPADVGIMEVTAPSDKVISISGTSRSYASLKQFLLNLKETGATLPDRQAESVGFEAVDLRSVSLDQQTGEYNFDLNLIVAKEGLRK